MTRSSDNCRRNQTEKIGMSYLRLSEDCRLELEILRNEKRHVESQIRIVCLCPLPPLLRCGRTRADLHYGDPIALSGATPPEPAAAVPPEPAAPPPLRPCAAVLVGPIARALRPTVARRAASMLQQDSPGPIGGTPTGGMAQSAGRRVRRSARAVSLEYRSGIVIAWPKGRTSMVRILVFVWAIGVLSASLWLEQPMPPGSKECGDIWVSVTCGSVR
jgi:hypothetical protein